MLRVAMRREIGSQLLYDLLQDLSDREAILTFLEDIVRVKKLVEPLSRKVPGHAVLDELLAVCRACQNFCVEPGS